MITAKLRNLELDNSPDVYETPDPTIQPAEEEEISVGSEDIDTHPNLAVKQASSRFVSAISKQHIPLSDVLDSTMPSRDMVQYYLDNMKNDLGRLQVHIDRIQQEDQASVALSADSIRNKLDELSKQLKSAPVPSKSVNLPVSSSKPAQSTTPTGILLLESRIAAMETLIGSSELLTQHGSLLSLLSSIEHQLEIIQNPLALKQDIETCTSILNNTQFVHLIPLAQTAQTILPILNRLPQIITRLHSLRTLIQDASSFNADINDIQDRTLVIQKEIEHLKEEFKQMA